MKANELMIGDWVNIYEFPNETPQKEDLFPARINAIMAPLPSEDGQENIECIFKTIDGGTGCASRPVDTCQPIPLTPEILERNGFEVIGKRKYYLVPNDASLAIKREPIIGAHGNTFLIGHFIDEKTFQWFIELTYIHELQHALRLCGIEKEIVL